MVNREEDPERPADRPSESVRFGPRPGADVATTVVLAVERLTGVPVDELPPLGRYVNPDALGELFDVPERAPAAGEPARVVFRYADCTVTVEADGSVVVESD